MSQNDRQAQARAARQRAMVSARDPDDEPSAPPVPAAPQRPFEEIVTEARPDVPRGLPVTFLRFVDRTMQVAGMQSGDQLRAHVLANGREHRVEYIPEMRHFLVAYIDAAKREVKYQFVHESRVQAWDPAPPPPAAS